MGMRVKETMTIGAVEEKETYIREAKGHIDAMNGFLLKLEKSPANREFMHGIFHAVHTLKGISGMMDCHNTEALCHSIEDVLSSVKKKKIRIDKCSDVLFNCFDTLGLGVKGISEGREEINTDILIEKIKEFLKSERPLTPPSPQSGDGKGEGGTPEIELEKIKTIEVKVERLDILMNLAEELLINKLRLDRLKEELVHVELSAVVDSMDRLISELQYNVMQSRMVPLGFIFNKFPRMVRDLAKQQKKEIELQIEGGDIELDRSVIDEVGESLIHLMRNAVDHGIESQEMRRKLHKPAGGTIRLSAKRTKGFAIIEISDDGMGLDINAIKKEAQRHGILSLEAAEEEILNTIFSGISTTKKATVISGRGFGLNIVKKKIETLGGNIAVDTKPLKGTRFNIEIPLTLAVINALLIQIGDKTYAIPIDGVERLIAVDKQDIKGLMNYEAVVVDNEDIPIVRLDLLFKVTSKPMEIQPIVIVRKDNDRLGLLVDSFQSTSEIVIKPLNKVVRNEEYAKYFSATSIIGTGEPILVLDVASLALTYSR